MAPGAGDRSLEETPTWAVAIVCAVFVIISVIIEHGIHSLAMWFRKRNDKSMLEALEKIKAELMLLGFISLLLTFGTSYIAKICVPKHIGDQWHPCDKNDDEGDDHDKEGEDKDGNRKLLSYAGELIWRRALAAETDETDTCAKKGKISLISYSGVHQLHIFIFVLAVMHVLYSVILVGLGYAKMKKWKAWELETTSLEYEFTNDPARFRFAHQTSFVRRHGGITSMPGIRWIVAFFRQFFGSISRVDYMAIRNGFINAHFAPNSKFDFHRYIKRSMEDDYKSVLGISAPLWLFAVIFLFFNFYISSVPSIHALAVVFISSFVSLKLVVQLSITNGAEWHTLSWLSLTPLIIIVLVGTKLELVIMEMAQQIQDRTTVVIGAPLVEPTNNFFWFNRPEWILFLIHFTLFMNAFQMAYFLWKWYEFGITKCFHEKLSAILIRVSLGVALHILCSYITFPLYSLVTQMGSHMKKTIFEEQTARALKKWHQAAKKKKKMRKTGEGNDASSHGAGFMSGETTPSQGFSPIHLLHKHKYRSNASDIESIPNSPTSYLSDTEISELEASIRSREELRQPHHTSGTNGESHSVDFSFIKS